MIKSLKPGMRTGAVTIPASKSMAHRMLICAALSDRKSVIHCDGISKDIEATMRCLRAFGTEFIRGEGDSLTVIPGVCKRMEKPLQLFCGESGSTLRFLLPLAAALGESVVFHMEGLLSNRPHRELIAQLEAHGVQIRKEGELLYCSGQLEPGEYVLPGNVSSQFISGLLFALPLLSGESRLKIEGSIESGAYIVMTEQAIGAARIEFARKEKGYVIPGKQKYCVPAEAAVERDWSNAAFFLCLGALSGRGVTLTGMNMSSSQGDRRILEVIKDFGSEVFINDETVLVRKGDCSAEPEEKIVDAAEIPDLVPVISALALGRAGDTRIVHAERLRFKESDRLQSTVGMIRALGGSAEETADGLVIHGGGQLSGGTVDPVNDHRIAMATAVAASLCASAVTVTDAECVGKSYPAFWEDYERLEVYS